MSGVTIAGRYRLERRIASGGMGEVWRARDELLQRPVAVKLLQDALAEDPVVAERFRREALLAASISHPNMANVYDFVEEDGRSGIVMELVDAETLAQRIARAGPLPVDAAVRITCEVLAALQAAHDAGIVHRDVKPANIMLAPGGIKVTDFGIARAIGESTLTKTGMVIGTAHYAAPEQVRGEAATPVSDVYGAGIVLYEALTGRRPFGGESAVAVAAARLTQDPSPPRSLRRDLPEALDRAVMIALAREPGARFPSAQAMREALERAVPGASGGSLAAAAVPRTELLPTQDAETVQVAAQASAAPPWERARAAEKRRWRERRTVRALAFFALLAGLAIAAFAIAARTSTVTVPKFVDTSIERARERAEAAGLKVEQRLRDDVAPRGRVLAQSIPEGQEVEGGTVVVLTVSSGTPPCCTVPKVEGMNLGGAQEALQKARLKLGKLSYERTRIASPGTVIHQEPVAGERVDPGTAVDILIAAPAERRDNGDNGDKRKGKGKGRD